MTRRIVLPDSKVRKVVIKEAPTRRVSLAGIGKTLGAEVIGSKPTRAGSPANFAAVRQEIFQRLRSTGGRPGLEGTEPKKIPLTEKDWKIVESVADHISEPGFKPSVGQVASVLLSITLRNMDTSLEAAVKRNLKAEGQAASRS